MAQQDVELARRIIAPVDDSVLDLADLNAPVYVRHDSRHLLRSDASTREALISGLSGAKPAFVFGAGDAELVRDALEAVAASVITDAV